MILTHLVDEFENLALSVLDGKLNLETAALRWHDLAVEQLGAFGFPEEQAKLLLKWGEEGHNWVALYFDDTVSKERYLKRFASDVRYCSDRMSLDRILRCNWLLHAAMNAT